MSMTEIEQIAAECGAVIGYTGPGGELAEAAFSRKGLHEFARRLATPKPAGAVLLPASCGADVFGGYYMVCRLDEVLRYGDAREAAGRADAGPAASAENLLEALDEAAESYGVAIIWQDAETYECKREIAIAALTAIAPNPPAAVNQPMTTQGEDTFGRFASWLLDKCEGMEVSEEMLQQQMVAMIESGYGLTGSQP